jgi:hypothetical protein
MEFVLKEDLKEGLYSFYKEKIPRPPRRLIEFYLGFYELIKDDLLGVILESIMLGKILGENEHPILIIFQKRMLHKPLRTTTPFLCVILFKKP